MTVLDSYIKLNGFGLFASQIKYEVISWTDNPRGCSHTVVTVVGSDDGSHHEVREMK